MDWNRNSHDELVRALNFLSPSIILKSEALRTSFQQLFERDTAEKCWELLPTKHKSSILALKSTRSPVPKPKPTAESRASQQTLTETPLEYFRKLPGVSNKQAGYLAHAVRGLTGADRLSGTAYLELWEGTAATAHKQEGLARLRRSCDSFTQFQQRSTQDELAKRLSRLIVANEVESVCGIEESTRCEKKHTKALKLVAKGADVDINVVQSHIKNSRNYYHYIAVAGIGGVIEIGHHVASLWEKDLKKESVLHLHKYREANLPESFDRAKKLHIVASKIITNRLITLGWTWDEILSSRTRLINRIAECLSEQGSSLSKLRDDYTNQPVPSSRPNDPEHSVSGRQRDAGPSSDAQRSKRRRIQLEDEGNSRVDFEAEGSISRNNEVVTLDASPPALDPWMMMSLNRAGTLQQFARQDPRWMPALGSPDGRHASQFASPLHYPEQISDYPQHHSNFPQSSQDPSMAILSHGNSLQALMDNMGAADPNMAILSHGNSLQALMDLIDDAGAADPSMAILSHGNSLPALMESTGAADPGMAILSHGNSLPALMDNMGAADNMWDNNEGGQTNNAIALQAMV